jgi:hypothetical protein
MGVLVKYGVMEQSIFELDSDELKPLMAVTITFDDGITVDGIFIRKKFNKCYVVTSLNVPHPPGWYVNRNQITIREEND